MVEIWITRSEDDEWDAYYDRPQPYDHEPFGGATDDKPATVQWRAQVQFSSVQELCELLDVPVDRGEARKIRIMWEDLQRNQAMLIGDRDA